MSRELVERLRNAGYDFYVVIGEVKYGQKVLENGKVIPLWMKHAWVCSKHHDICIEATTGTIIHPKYYREHYRED